MLAILHFFQKCAKNVIYMIKPDALTNCFYRLVNAVLLRETLPYFLIFASKDYKKLQKSIVHDALHFNFFWMQYFNGVELSAKLDRSRTIKSFYQAMSLYFWLKQSEKRFILTYCTVNAFRTSYQYKLKITHEKNVLANRQSPARPKSTYS